jgi:general stress protein CsbA
VASSVADWVDENGEEAAGLTLAVVPFVSVALLLRRTTNDVVALALPTGALFGAAFLYEAKRSRFVIETAEGIAIGLGVGAVAGTTLTAARKLGSVLRRR